MDKNYDVEDILSEIKRKKAQSKAGAPQEASREEPRQEGREPWAPRRQADSFREMVERFGGEEARQADFRREEHETPHYRESAGEEPVREASKASDREEPLRRTAAREKSSGLARQAERAEERITPGRETVRETPPEETFRRPPAHEEFSGSAHRPAREEKKPAPRRQAAENTSFGQETTGFHVPKESREGKKAEPRAAGSFDWSGSFSREEPEESARPAPRSRWGEEEFPSLSQPGFRVTIREEEPEPKPADSPFPREFGDAFSGLSIEGDIPLEQEEEAHVPESAKRIGFSRVDLSFGLEEGKESGRSRRGFGKKRREEPEEAPEGDIEDYNSPADKQAIIADFKSIKTGLLVRLVLTMICFTASLYCAFSYLYQIPLPPFMFPERDMRMFLIVNTAIAAAALLICSNIVGAGILSLVRLRADSDTLPALAGIATIVQGIVFILRPEEFNATGVHLFFPVAILGYLFNLIGKTMLSNRIARNFKLVSSDLEKNAAFLTKDRELVRELTKDTPIDNYEIICSRKAGQLSRFLELSYSEDQCDSVYRIASPVCLLGAAAIGVISGIMEGGPFVGVSAAAAILCICAPFSSTLIANLPMDRLSTKLTKEGAMVSGYQPMDEFSQAEAMVLEASDLFPEDLVTLHGIKAFDESKIDEILVDAASVICSGESPLRGVFTRIIGGNLNMLRPVTAVSYEDSGGLLATVGGRQILIGNRQLMRAHGVEAPSREYEERLAGGGKEMVYLATEGKLSALFLVSYQPSRQAVELLERLGREDMVLFVHTLDPNITADKVSDAFEYPLELVRIMSSSAQSAYGRETAPAETSPASIGFIGSRLAMVSAVLGAISARRSITVGLVMQLAAIFIGYGLVTLLSLLGNLPSIGFTHVLLYQGVWTGLIAAVPNLRKL